MSQPVQPPGSPAGTFVRRVPEGDNHERLVCGDCGFVQYENPKVVVGSVCSWEDRILLCRRAINPRKGFWTLPAGYLELNESTGDGALREAWEEARAKIEIEGVLAVYTITRLRQVQVIYRARLVSPDVSAGPESAEVGPVPLGGNSLAGDRLPLGPLGALPLSRGRSTAASSPRAAIRRASSATTGARAFRCQPDAMLTAEAALHPAICSSALPAATSTAAAMRRGPKGSPSRTVPMTAARITLVSRRAETWAMRRLSIAQMTMP